MAERLRLAVIVASVRKDRVGPAVARWLVGQIARRSEDPDVDLVDLAELCLPDDLGGGGDTGAYTARIARADAVVVVTPEYNRGYPGALKTAIDTAVDEWRAKPVGFVSYGGVSGGLRAVEQLRLVFAALHTVTVQASVSLPDVWDRLDERGELRHHDRAAAAADQLLRQLTWWATVLRQAQPQTAYDG